MDVSWRRLVLLIVMTSSAIAVVTSAAPIVFHLSEELPSGTPVGNVKISSNITQEVAEADRENLQFHILSGDGLRITSIFSINSRTGAIFTNAMIDREQLCPMDLSCNLDFDITVKLDGNFLKLLAVRVVVDDVNDNAPSFPKEAITLTVPESAPVGSEIPISGALDRDAGINSTTISYSLEVSNVFGLREVRQLDGTSALRLVVNTALDREAVASYAFFILASDGPGPDSMTGTLTVSVLVEDVNDNVPSFTKDTFDLTVMETAPVGTVFGHLTASDGDVGPNGQLTFRFSLLTSSEVTSLFSLNSTSGELSVAGDLPYESGRTFQCVVEVTDLGVPPRASQAILRILVEDSGNTPPKLHLILAEPVYGDQSAMLSEDVQLGTFVGTLRAEDLDEGEEGRVVCSSGDPHFSLQDLDSDRYGIVLSSSLDREESQELRVVLYCEDGGDPPLTSSTSFKVIVRDVNDNAPVFTQQTYRPSLTENGRGEQFVVQVVATDRDDSTNNVVTYSLDPQSLRLFSVESSTGRITTLSTFDRELTPYRSLTVFATDSGSPALSGSATVSVRIADVNDNPPYVNRSDYYISENLPVGAIVNLSLADRDEGENGTVVVTLLRESLSPGESIPFQVLYNGSLRVSSALDRERTSSYQIPVLLRDMGSPALSSTATLTVQLVDNNDHTPTFLFPTALNDTVQVITQLPVGSSVCQIRAEDGDLGMNGVVSYSITDGNAGQWLAINNVTGHIFTVRSLASLAGTTLHLQVAASDFGDPPLVARAFLDVYLRSNRSGALHTGGDDSSGDRYVIIAGVLAGVTFIVAVVVIAVIVHMRNSDLRRRTAAMRSKARKEEEEERGKALTKLSVLCPQTVASGEVGKPGTTTATSSPTSPSAGMARYPPLNLQLDEGRGFGSPVAFSAAPSPAVSAAGGGGGGVNAGGGSAVPVTHGAVMESSGGGGGGGGVKGGDSFFVDFTEGRNRLMSEDHNSDTSGETTTCDSGRGASDEEIVYPVTGKTGSSEPPPRVPPRQPVTSPTPTPTPSTQWSRDVHVLSTNWAAPSPTPSPAPGRCYVAEEGDTSSLRRGIPEEGDEADDPSSFLGDPRSGYYRSTSRKGPLRVRFSFDKGDGRSQAAQDCAGENDTYSAALLPDITEAAHMGHAAYQEGRGGKGDRGGHTYGSVANLHPYPNPHSHSDHIYGNRLDHGGQLFSSTGQVNGGKDFYPQHQHQHQQPSMTGHSPAERTYLRLTPESKYPRRTTPAAEERFPRKVGQKSHLVHPAVGWQGGAGGGGGGGGRSRATESLSSLGALSVEDDVSTTTSGSYSIESEADCMNASLEC